MTPVFGFVEGFRAIQGRQDRQSPRARGKREFHREGQDHPPVSPAKHDMVMRRTHGVMMTPFAVDTLAAMLRGGVVHRDQHRFVGWDLTQDGGRDYVAQRPQGPDRAREHPMVGAGVPGGQTPQGPQNPGNGSPPGGQNGSHRQCEDSLKGWVGISHRKSHEQRPCDRWNGKHSGLLSDSITVLSNKVGWSPFTASVFLVLIIHLGNGRSRAKERSMKYFMLNPECYFIKGAVRGAVYNLHTGSVFSVGPELTALLSACETDRKPLDRALKCTNAPQDEAMRALNTLWKEKLGRFYETENSPPIIEKLKPGEKKNFQGRAKLEVLHAELSGECNLNCVFCDRESSAVTRKEGCARWPKVSANTTLELEDWEKIVSDGEKLGCEKLVFVGGEPLLVWNDLSHLIRFAGDIGYKGIKLDTNGYLLDEEKIRFLKQHDVLVSLQILSFKEAMHDKMTQVPGSFKKTMQNLENMMEHKVRLAFVLPLVAYNEDHWAETMEWFDGYDAEDSRAMFMYPKSSGNFEHVSRDMLSKAYRTSNKPFEDVKAKIFFEHAQCNAWFSGHLAVTSYGDILPRPTAREEIIANIQDKDLIGVFRDEDMFKYWLLTKDEVEICRDCEYRYACVDNRPIERSLSGKLKGRSEFCTYDPYKGAWMNTIPTIEDAVTSAV